MDKGDEEEGQEEKASVGNVFVFIIVIVVIVIRGGVFDGIRLVIGGRAEEEEAEAERE